MLYSYIFIVFKFCIIRPIVRSCYDYLIVNNAKFVVHKSSSLRFLYFNMGELRNVNSMFTIYSIIHNSKFNLNTLLGLFNQFLK